MDFEPCFKVHNLVYVYLKSIKPGQMTTLNMIFHVVVSVPCTISEWLMDLFGVYDTILCEGQTRHKLQEMYWKSD